MGINWRSTVRCKINEDGTQLLTGLPADLIQLSKTVYGMRVVVIQQN